jgi:hypothetical protein
MTVLRTQVGIVEWARRARGARAVELALADALGGLIAQADGAAAKIDLARAARRHGWYAELWAGVVPVLHDHDAELAAVDGVAGVPPVRGDAVTFGDDPRAAVEVVSGALAAVYRSWLAETTPVAEAPIAAVLSLVVDLEAGAHSR